LHPRTLSLGALQGLHRATLALYRFIHCACAHALRRRRDSVAAPQEGIDFNQKHFTENSWTLWFDNPSGRQKATTWGASLRNVYTFSTVEDFWWCATLGSPRPAAWMCVLV
jgi:hypothetical protein